MASDRAKAKQDVDPGSRDSNEPAGLASALDDARSVKLATLKEEHRHKEVMKDKEISSTADAREKELSAEAQSQAHELGRFGWLLGGPTSSPTAIASIAAIAGVIIALYALHAAKDAHDPNPWFHEAELGGTMTLSTISFIFGRSSSQRKH